MRIQNGEPKYLQLNAHSIGALYEYNKETGNYDFLSGESLDVLGIDFNVEYPEIVNSIEGHPEIFIANGSHGNWGQPGKYSVLGTRYLFIILYVFYRTLNISGGMGTYPKSDFRVPAIN